MSRSASPHIVLGRIAEERREPDRGLSPPIKLGENGTRHYRAGREYCRGDDCRFVPPDPPHSALALKSEVCGRRAGSRDGDGGR